MSPPIKVSLVFCGRQQPPPFRHSLIMLGAGPAAESSQFMQITLKVNHLFLCIWIILSTAQLGRPSSLIIVIIIALFSQPAQNFECLRFVLQPGSLLIRPEAARQSLGATDSLALPLPQAPEASMHSPETTRTALAFIPGRRKSELHVLMGISLRRKLSAS